MHDVPNCPQILVQHVRHAGFTLIELLLAVAVFAIVVSLAAPAFNDLVLRHRTSSTANTFLADLATARTEATQRRRTVNLCARPANDTDTACTAANQGSGACGCSGNNWENGWLTYVDVDGDGDLGDSDDGDVLLGVQAPLANNASLRRNGAAAINGSVGFNGRGNLVGTPVTFALCMADDTGDTQDDTAVLDRARFVTVALTGRAAVRGKLPSENATSSACRFGGSA